MEGRLGFLIVFAAYILQNHLWGDGNIHEQMIDAQPLAVVLSSSRVSPRAIAVAVAVLLVLLGALCLTVPALLGNAAEEAFSQGVSFDGITLALTHGEEEEE